MHKSLYLIPNQIYAFKIYDEYGEDYAEYVDPIKVPDSSLSWEIFANTLANEECGFDSEGFNLCITRPIYDKAIQGFAEKEVEITGYMFPLEPTEYQKNFLIGPYPLSCPFHYHSKPNQVIEVISKTKIQFSYEPITIRGKLSLDFDEEKGSFFYLFIE